MDNISFKANFIVNKNMYKNLPEGTPENFPQSLIDEYRSFIEAPRIKELTEGDTIELSRKKYHTGYSVKLTYTTDKFSEPVEIPICTNKKIPNIHPWSLISQTLYLLAYMYDKGDHNYFESTNDWVNRVLFDGNKVLK